MVADKNASIDAGQPDDRSKYLSKNMLNKNEEVYSGLFFSAMLGFILGLRNYPINSLWFERLKFFQLRNRDNRAVGFISLRVKPRLSGRGGRARNE